MKRDYSLIWLAVSLYISMLITFMIAKTYVTAKQPTQISENNLKTFLEVDLRQFDGTNASKPIYLAMAGLVYDVSVGREYYQEGGTYHFLAGRDASLELKMFGGNIIKEKYPVVGRLVEGI